MYLKKLGGVMLASSVALMGCNSSSDSDNSDQTTLTNQDAARAFVMDLKNVMVPVAETQNVLASYSAQLNQDLATIDPQSSAALLVVTNAALQALVDRIEDAYVVNDSGYLTAIDWDRLPETINVDGFSGLTITRNGSVVSISGNNLETETGQTASIAATLTLPPVDVTADLVTIAIGELRLTDAIGSQMTIDTGTFTIHYNDVLNANEAKDFIIDDVTASMNALMMTMGDIEISGDGTLHLTVDPINSDSGLNSFDITDDDTFNRPFSILVDGELKNSQGIVLDTKTTLALDYDRHFRRYYTSDPLSNLDIDVSFEFDLTDKNTSDTLLLATMALDVEFDDGGQYDEGIKVVIDDVTGFQFNGSLSLTVGQTQVGFGINTAMKDGVPEQAYLFDTTNKTQDVRLTYRENPISDFDKKEITFASITVDGTTLADVVLDWNENKLIADFDSQEDVVLLSDARLATLIDALDLE